MWVSGSRSFALASFALALAGCSSPSPKPSASEPAPSVERCFGDTIFPDADGDGYGASDSEGVRCENGTLPAGFTNGASDCDDSDPGAFRIYQHDADGDGVGNWDDTLCAGDVAPAGYLTENGQSDCDDADPTLFHTYFVDADGDGYAPADAVTVCGGDPPPPNAVPGVDYPGDCDDDDPNARTLYYEDLDGDGYAASTDVSVCAPPGAPPSGFGIYVSGWADCDDSRADVNVKALEFWSDALDSDCDGSPMPYGCADESCDPAAGDEPVDTGCDGADLAVVDVAVEEECYRAVWTVTLANRGTEDVPSFTLVVETPTDTLRYDVPDSLAPGRRRSYPLSRWLNISGEVHFSVESPIADCNADDDSLVKLGGPLSCAF